MLIIFLTRGKYQERPAGPLCLPEVFKSREGLLDSD